MTVRLSSFLKIKTTIIKIKDDNRPALNHPVTNAGKARIDHSADPSFLNEAH